MCKQLCKTQKKSSIVENDEDRKKTCYYKIEKRAKMNRKKVNVIFESMILDVEYLEKLCYLAKKN